MTSAGLIMRRSGPDDAEAIANLMTTAFGGNDGQLAFGPEWWHWKYGGNPAGFQGLVAQDDEGRVVGHFGGIPMEVRVDDERLTFAQSCDTCTDPEVRRGLHNPGLFARLAQAYTSTYGIPGSNAAMYGLPNRRAYRIGSRYSDYWMLRQQWLLVARGKPTSTADRGIEVSESAVVDDDVTALYESLLPRYRCMARRDARFLRWRFLDAPGSPYTVTVARNAGDGALRAYAVHRRAHLMGDDVGMIMDWLCDPADHAAADALQGAVRGTYAADGLLMVVFLCPTSSAWFREFQRWGFRVQPSQYMMTARPFVPQLEPRFLREHWYYTLADFDIF